jgi:DNA-binding CsgD family transcriptional regulator
MRTPPAKTCCGETISSASGDRLVARDDQVNRTLEEIFSAANDDGDGIGTKGIAVPLIGKHGERYVAHALPLTSGARRRAGAAYSAVAAVFIRKASLETPSSMETMSKLYGLTPGELRVLAAVSEVGGVPAVAEVVGISQATVKTHLQHLFAKTGTRRQLDLVRLVAAHASPLGQIRRSKSTEQPPTGAAVQRFRTYGLGTCSASASAASTAGALTTAASSCLACRCRLAA